MPLSDWLLHTCTVQRNVGTGKDPDGIPIPRWNNWQVWVKCRLMVNAQREVEDQGAQQAIITEYTMLVPAGTLVAKGDRITDVTLEDGTVLSESFDVEAVMVRRARTGAHHVTLELKRIG